MQHTSPHPLAEVTLLKAKLMVPPPFPLWVDNEPDKMAVSFEVRGACSMTHKTLSPLLGITQTSVFTAIIDLTVALLFNQFQWELD